jgi:hypothetical protein
MRPRDLFLVLSLLVLGAHGFNITRYDNVSTAPPPPSPYNLDILNSRILPKLPPSSTYLPHGILLDRVPLPYVLISLDLV